MDNPKVRKYVVHYGIEIAHWRLCEAVGIVIVSRDKEIVTCETCRWLLEG